MTELGLESRLSGSGALSYFFIQFFKVKRVKAADFKMATITIELCNETSRILACARAQKAQKVHRRVGALQGKLDSGASECAFHRDPPLSPGTGRPALGYRAPATLPDLSCLCLIKVFPGGQ